MAPSCVNTGNYRRMDPDGQTDPKRFRLDTDNNSKYEGSKQVRKYARRLVSKVFINTDENIVMKKCFGHNSQIIAQSFLRKTSGKT